MCCKQKAPATKPIRIAARHYKTINGDGAPAHQHRGETPITDH
jgi:hypothetical protein